MRSSGKEGAVAFSTSPSPVVALDFSLFVVVRGIVLRRLVVGFVLQVFRFHVRKIFLPKSVSVGEVPISIFLVGS